MPRLSKSPWSNWVPPSLAMKSSTWRDENALAAACASPTKAGRASRLATAVTVASLRVLLPNMVRNLSKSVADIQHGTYSEKLRVGDVGGSTVKYRGGQVN